MSLRARLTTAFLVVVLGPVLVGAIFVGVIVTAVSDTRTAEQLERASVMVESTIGTACERIQTSAATMALAHSHTGEDVAGEIAQLIVQRDIADSVVVDNGDSKHFYGAAMPNGVHAVCDEPIPQAASQGAIVALSATGELQDSEGNLIATYTATRLVNQNFLDQLARATDSHLTLIDGRDPPLTAGISDTEEDFITADSVLPIHIGVPASSMAPMYWTLASMVAISAICAVALAAWLSRSTTRPLTDLSEATRRVADGNLESRVPVRGRDEVAHLATRFNQMTMQLQRYVQALTSSRDQIRGQLKRLGQTLSSTLDLDRILEVILETAIVSTSASAGLIVLVDVDDPDLLVQRAGEGELGIDDVVRVRIGHGILGGIAAAGKPFRGRIVEGETGGYVRVAGEPRASTMIAVPFTGSGPGGTALEHVPVGNTLGVLVLYNRYGGQEFNSSDLQTLGTFAKQASVAVENVLLHRQAERLSLTDPLTGLWNYRFLQVSLQREIDRVRRFNRPSALLAIDLDHFKAVNDTYGHPVGDQVLAEVARRLNAQIRDVDSAFRQGGEEFMVLLPETNTAGANTVAERLSQAVSSQPFTVRLPGDKQSIQLNITISLGIAVFGEHGSNTGEIISAADNALYAAKSAGRDTWRVAQAH
ncbi:diguanylate cyclase [Natronoglycomyces albus]|uniref:Diguanylate cyclase n=1 Tax=Natronoglycomyces albus TaxID=2811108 RepID=A0A895XSS6_9ACTN|nr:diguanylate cyclase [Natronoglycomyces albus]QSB04688.1 diguanylate cyclase [Natronoglycomyces albus]